MAYFDWNATTPLLSKAREAWLNASDARWGNPSTPYRLGAQAKLLLEVSRESVAGLMGVEPTQVVFTSGATESNNGFLREAARKFPQGEIWISAIEHPSVREATHRFWGEERARQMPVLPDGLLDLDWMVARLEKDRPAMISLMAANNETGVLQPFRQVAELCRSRGIEFHCDAVQWPGKDPEPFSGWGTLSGVTLSAHKFGGPKGTGCMILGPDWQGTQWQVGGSQELGSRAGTEDLAGIDAMAVALEDRMGRSEATGQAGARDRFESELTRIWPEVVIHGRKAPRIGNTSSVSLPVFNALRWISRLDRHGFQVSTGAACSAGKKGSSVVLRAMGVDEATARRTIRISAGWETTESDWQELLAALVEVRAELEESGTPGEGPGKVINIGD